MKNCYMISYDLFSPTNNRDDVEDSIKSLGSWCKYVSPEFDSFEIETLTNLDKI